MRIRKFSQIHFTIFFSIGILLTLELSAQSSGDQKDSTSFRIENVHLEKNLGNSSFFVKASNKRSPAYTYSTNEILTVQVNIDEEGLNKLEDAANEPSMAINPLNRDQIVIGWRQFDHISSNFRQAGYAYSSDGGTSWNNTGVIEPGIFRSDPVLDSDSQGNIYYNSLSHDANDNFVCHIYISSNGGISWDSKLYAAGGDKQWMTIDKSYGSSNGYIYEMWTYAYGLCAPMSFVRSTDKGISFEECVMVPEQLYWGTLAVGRTGDLFIGGINSLYWNTNNETFVVAKSTTAKDSASLVTWDHSVRVNLDGSLGYGVGPNPGGILGQTWITVDTSGSESDGNVYLLASIERASISDPLDVMFSRSTDGGLTWIDPVRVNDDLGLDAWQWFGTMSVAPNGRIDVVWLDTRDDPANGYLSALYYSYSSDAGDTWAPNIKLSELFDPHIGWPDQRKMGDYFHMISDNGGANLAWAATLNGEQDVYHSRITTPVVSVELSNNDIAVHDYKLFQNYPNPFNPATTISFRVPVTSHVSLKVFTNIGEEIGVLVNQLKHKGIHTITFDASELASGVYYYVLAAQDYKEIRKMVLLQ